MLIIRNSNILGEIGNKDILVGDDGKYKEISAKVNVSPKPGTQVIDAKGMLVAPTFVNTHMHFDKVYTALNGRESSVETL